MTLAPSVMTYRAMLIAAFSTAIIAHAQISQAQTISEKDAYEIARDAYIYAYPLVLMDATRQQLTNFVVPPPAGPGAATSTSFRTTTSSPF